METSQTINQAGKLTNKYLSNIQLNKIDVLGAGLGLFFGYTDYLEARREGKSPLAALAKATATNVMFDLLGFWGGLAYTGISLGSTLIATGYQMYDLYSSQLPKTIGPFANRFVDTNAAYTMRQRAIQAIQQSKINARSALGNEAYYLHR